MQKLLYLQQTNWTWKVVISFGECNFDKLKLATAIAPILSAVDPLKPFVVKTDASGTAVGAVLL